MKLQIPDTLRITNPLWVEKLENRTTWKEIITPCTIKGKELAIGDFQCCIVGEALNLFDVDWGESQQRGESDQQFHNNCIICSGASMNLYHDIFDLEGDDDTDVEELERDLKDFASHLEDVHPEYIEEAKKRNA